MLLVGLFLVWEWMFVNFFVILRRNFHYQPISSSIFMVPQILSKKIIAYSCTPSYPHTLHQSQNWHWPLSPSLPHHFPPPPYHKQHSASHTNCIQSHLVLILKIPIKGAVAFSNPIIPIDVKTAAPNWLAFTDKGLMLMPRKWKMNLDTGNSNDTTNAGRCFMMPMRCLCYVSPLFLFISFAFPLMNWVISSTLLLCTSSTKTMARSFPSSMSTTQLTSDC